jgi:hypothetical protein
MRKAVLMRAGDYRNIDPTNRRASGENFASEK